MQTRRLTFFIDENISKYAASMLACFDRDNQIEAHSDFFSSGTPDIDWMKNISQRKDKPIVVCGDGRILRNKVEKKVLSECNLMFVYLASGWTNLPWPEFAWKIIKVWPDIVKNIERANFPTLFEVSVGGLKVQSLGRISSL